MAFEGTSRVLLTIRETSKRDDPGQGWGLWVISYDTKDGKNISVKVVCGTFSTDPGTGAKRYYAKGMGIKDFNELRPRWKEAEAIMKNPPPLNGQGDLPQEEAPF